MCGERGSGNGGLPCLFQQPSELKTSLLLTFNLSSPAPHLVYVAPIPFIPVDSVFILLFTFLKVVLSSGH